MFFLCSLGAQSGPLTVASNGVASSPSAASLTIQYPPGSICSASDIQNRLNNGQTPLYIYNLCGKTLVNLYGRSYKGGLIAYLNTSDGTGFVAAPTDYTANACWTNISRGSYIWVGATATAIGAGKANTAAIVQALGTPTQIVPAVFNYAAYAATQASYGGYRDRYLPDQNEMTQVMLNIITPQGCYNGISQGAPGGYWTSTETNFNTAVYTGCEGNPHVQTKNNSWSVRLIRAFETKPSVASFEPAVIGFLQTLTITGSNFSPTPWHNTVTFTGGKGAYATGGTTASLTVTVPVGAQTGSIAVVTDGVSGALSMATLTIQPPPTVSLVSTSSAPTPPAGMWAVCNTGPNSPIPDGASTTCPVISYNGLTFWPFSYDDSRFSIGLVGYNGNAVAIQQEWHGARYAYKVTVEIKAQTITIWGQGGHSASAPWSKLK